MGITQNDPNNTPKKKNKVELNSAAAESLYNTLGGWYENMPDYQAFQNDLYDELKLEKIYGMIDDNKPGFSKSNSFDAFKDQIFVKPKQKIETNIYSPPPQVNLSPSDVAMMQEESQSLVGPPMPIIKTDEQNIFDQAKTSTGEEFTFLNEEQKKYTQEEIDNIYLGIKENIDNPAYSLQEAYDLESDTGVKTLPGLFLPSDLVPHTDDIKSFLYMTDPVTGEKSYLTKDGPKKFDDKDLVSIENYINDNIDFFRPDVDGDISSGDFGNIDYFVEALEGRGFPSSIRQKVKQMVGRNFFNEKKKEILQATYNEADDNDFEKYLNSKEIFMSNAQAELNDYAQQMQDTWYSENREKFLTQDRNINYKYENQLKSAISALDEKYNTLFETAADTELESLEEDYRIEKQNKIYEYENLANFEKEKLREKAWDLNVSSFEDEYNKKAIELFSPKHKHIPESWYNSTINYFKSKSFQEAPYDTKKVLMSKMEGELRKVLKKGGKSLNYIEGAIDEFYLNVGDVVFRRDDNQMTSFAIKEFAQAQLDDMNEIEPYFMEQARDKAKRDIGKEDLFVSGNKVYYPSTGNSGAGFYYPGLDGVSGDQFFKAKETLKKVVSLPDGDGSLKTFWKGLTSQDSYTYVPFFASMEGMNRLNNLNIILKKKESGQVLSYPEEMMLNSYATLQTLKSTGDIPWAYNAGQSVAGSIPFIAEFVATGGVGKVTQKAVETGLKKMVKKQVEKKIKREITEKVFERAINKGMFKYTSQGLGYLMSAAAQTTVNPQRYMEATMERMMPQNIIMFSPDGDDVVEMTSKNGEDFGEAFLKGFGSTFSEFLSERLFQMIPVGKIPVIEKAMKRLAVGTYMKKMGFETIEDTSKYIMKNKVGFDGIFAELGEEFFNESLTNIITGDKGAFEFSADDIKVLVTATGVMGGGMTIVENTLRYAPKQNKFEYTKMVDGKPVNQSVTLPQSVMSQLYGIRPDNIDQVTTFFNFLEGKKGLSEEQKSVAQYLAFDKLSKKEGELETKEGVETKFSDIGYDPSLVSLETEDGGRAEGILQRVDSEKISIVDNNGDVLKDLSGKNLDAKSLRSEGIELVQKESIEIPEQEAQAEAFERDLDRYDAFVGEPIEVLGEQKIFKEPVYNESGELTELKFSNSDGSIISYPSNSAIFEDVVSALDSGEIQVESLDISPQLGTTREFTIDHNKQKVQATVTVTEDGYRVTGQKRNGKPGTFSPRTSFYRKAVEAFESSNKSDVSLSDNSQSNDLGEVQYQTRESVDIPEYRGQNDFIKSSIAQLEESNSPSDIEGVVSTLESLVDVGDVSEGELEMFKQNYSDPKISSLYGEIRPEVESAEYTNEIESPISEEIEIEYEDSEINDAIVAAEKNVSSFEDESLLEFSSDPFVEEEKAKEDQVYMDGVSVSTQTMAKYLDLFGLLNQVQSKLLFNFTNNLEDKVASLVGKGLLSKNNIIRSGTFALQSFLKGTGFTNKNLEAIMDMMGGSEAAYKQAYLLKKSMDQMVDNNYESLQKVHQVLDPYAHLRKEVSDSDLSFKIGGRSYQVDGLVVSDGIIEEVSLRGSDNNNIFVTSKNDVNGNILGYVQSKLDGLYDSGVLAKESDLSDPESSLLSRIKKYNDYVHDMNFSSGFLDMNTYQKYKGRYVPRMYYENELPQELQQAMEGYKAGGTTAFKSNASSIDLNMFKRRKTGTQESYQTIVDDVSYLTAKRLAQANQNRAIKEYSDWLVKNKSDVIITSEQVKEKEALDPGWSMDPENTRGLVKLSDNKKYGSLSGAYVPNYIAEDFTGSRFGNMLMDKFHDFAKAYDNTATRQFLKKRFTVYNPVVQIGNIMSNFAFAMASGIGPHIMAINMVEAVKDLKNNGKYSKHLLSKGVLNSDVVSRDFIPTSQLELSLKGKKGFGRAKQIAKKVSNVAEKLYQNSDNVAKIAAYISFRQQGFSDSESIRKVYDGFQNYAMVGRAWDLASRTPFIGGPFVRFKADLNRIIKNAMVKTPLTTATFLMMLKMAGEVISSAGDEDDDIQRMREDLEFQPKIKSIMWQGAKDYEFEVGKGADKIPLIGQYLAGRKINPFGDIPLTFRYKDKSINLARFISPYYVYDKSSQESPSQWIFDRFSPYEFDIKESSPVFSDPLLGPIVDLLRDKDFRGQPISDDTKTKYTEGVATEKEKMSRRAIYSLRAYVPMFKFLNDMYLANKGGEDYYDRLKSVPDVITSQFVKIEQLTDKKVGERTLQKLNSLQFEWDSEVDKLKSVDRNSRKEIIKLKDRRERGEIDLDTHLKLLDKVKDVHLKRVDNIEKSKYKISNEFQRLFDKYKIKDGSLDFLIEEE